MSWPSPLPSPAVGAPDSQPNVIPPSPAPVLSSNLGNVSGLNPTLGSALSKINLAATPKEPSAPGTLNLGKPLNVPGTSVIPGTPGIQPLTTSSGTAYRRSKPIVRTRDQPSQYPSRFMELDLMNLQCGSCETYLIQIDIQNALRRGKTLFEVMNELGYDRLCCRIEIEGAPPIVQLQKQLEKEQELEQKLKTLTVESTGAIPSQIPAVSLVAPKPPIRIEKDAPPGARQFSGICLTSDSRTQESYEEGQEGEGTFDIGGENVNFGI